ncbi:MAG: homoserine kinase [Bacteroidetes bacterium HGW-Bacteroidetes-5]|jgi:homoserine kinase|nr:MAG: homoserine kinase [Bacteroidetes bacterium HGW-Bacteroidetes-5]
MRTKNKEIRVFAPATVSNIACGFDVMGFAIDMPGDELVLRVSEKPGVRIVKITGDNGRLTYNPEFNTGGKPILSMMRAFGIDCGVEIEIHKQMPLGSGLGSSAASAVAAAFAMNKLFELNLSESELLPFAIEGEMIASGSLHADNVAPALYGGFVLIRSYHPIDIIKLDVPKELFCSVIHPHIEISTKEARELLPEQIPLSTAIRQWGNTAALVAGLLKSDFALIGRSLEDFVAEPVRSRLIPGFAQMKQAALDAGAIGCSISGSGPSLFALSDSRDRADKIAKSMQMALNTFKLGSDLYVSAVNTQGPRILNCQTFA